MYMTRDKVYDEISIWEEKSDFFFSDGQFHLTKICKYEDEYYQKARTQPIITVGPKGFKQIFPKQKLPRRGSCKYVELKLHIPGEG